MYKFAKMTKPRGGGGKLTASLLMAGVLALCANATPTVTIDSVTQRWPWNNKVDITYTVADGQESAPSGFYRIVFTATIGGNEYTIDDASGVHANASTGQHTVTWTLPGGIGTTDCSMVARIYTSDTPSGDDYMIVDLTTGAVTYEGMITQAASNARYNNDASGPGGTNVYKTTKLVLRKIPCTAQSASLPNGPFADGYPTGDDTNFASTNGRTNWITRLDYYMAIYPVTQGQYAAITGGNPAAFKTDAENNIATYRPVENVGHYQSRGSNDPAVVPTPSDVSGKSFLERLNGRTKNACGVTGFDLPTEVMFEIALRAGKTNTYAYNSYTESGTSYAYSGAGTYMVYGLKDAEVPGTRPVGSKSANSWGLYDMNGNVLQWCLDDNSRVNLKDAPDPWTAAYVAGATRFSLNDALSWKQWPGVASKASYRFSQNTSWNETGFRVAFIVK